MPRHSSILNANIEAYLKVLSKEGRKDRTIKDYRYLLKTAMASLDGLGMETNPRQMGRDEIDHLRFELWGHLKPSVNRRQISILGTYLEWYGNNIVKQMRIHWPQDVRIHVDWLSLEESRAMLNASQGEERMLIHMELCLGLRRCEVVRLRASDVLNGRIDVRGKGRGEGKWRTLPYHPDTHHELERYMRLRSKMISDALCRKPDQHVPDALMTYAQYGWKLGAYKRSSIDNKVKAAARRAGISRSVSNHTLRRTCGRNLHLAGVPIETISKILGHEDTRTTIKYLGLNFDDMSAAMFRLGQFLGNQEHGKASQ